MARVIRASSHTYAHLPALVTFFGGGCSMTVLSNHKVSRARPFNQLKKNTISCKELAFITRVNPDISGWPPLT